jgi:copper chaperone NosL
LLAGCGRAEIKPVDIVAEDMCALCKMAISEKQYAAEFITHDGEPLKFDDIGCMVRYLEGQQNKDDIAAYFVVDFDSREWVRAEAAHYIRSSELQTPMSGGIVAFKDQSKMEAAAAQYQGDRLRFSDLLD